MNESSAREIVVWRGPMQTFDRIFRIISKKNYSENESSARVMVMVVWQGPIQSLV